MVFWTDKRPVTADLLKRLDLSALAEALGRGPEYRAFSSSTQTQLSFADVA